MSRLSPARQEAEEREAQAYAMAILHSNGRETRWGQWNREIIARWSETALRRIKTRAWQIVEGDSR